MLEIERKFIMQGFPEDILSREEMAAYNLKLTRKVAIEQGYLSVEPEVRLHGARDLQSGEENYRLTLKGGGTLSRTEVITDVALDFYEEAKSMLPGKMIEKTYHKYQFGELILEVCYVDPGTKDEFYYGEIEFFTEEEAREFEPPAFLSMEVTYDESCKMKNYWKRTRL
jgi:CYTH domain-containing protein